jgi:DoxX-like family
LQFDAETTPVSNTTLWAGRIVSALPVLFLLFDGAIKLIGIPPVVEAFNQLGYPVSLAPGIGILELACVVIYVIPRTAVLGAILLTGFLGGAIATHVRVGDPLLTHDFFPIYVGVLVWGGLFLRDARLRALIPIRS